MEPSKWQPSWARLWLALGGLILAATVAFLYKAYVVRSSFTKLKALGFPVIPHSMIWGHLHVLNDFRAAHPPGTNTKYLQPWLALNYKKYLPGEDQVPPMIYLDIWPVTIVPFAVVFDVAMATQLTQSSVVTKGMLQKTLFKRLTGMKDLFSMEGAEWKTWRTRFNPAFSNRNITALIPDIIDEVLVFEEAIEQNLGKEGNWGPVFQLWKLTSALTTDVIIRALIDERLHDQTTPGGSPVRLALYDTIRKGAVARSWLRNWHLVYKMPSFEAAIARNNRLMYDFFWPAIQRTLGSNSAKTQRKTVLNLACTQLGQKRAEGTQQGLDKDTIDAILGHLKVMIFAGFDTTATTLCWMFDCLERNPQCLAKLIAEHGEVLGSDPEQAADTLRKAPHLLNSLPYTTAVLKETMRLNMPVFIVRQGEPDVFLVHRESGIRYPTDGFAVLDGSAWLHVDPQYWPRADEFLPQRWLVSSDDPLYPVPHAWRGFGVGPRHCIGQELAMVEMKLVAALMVRRFEIEEDWEGWDRKMDPKYAKHTLDGRRLYGTGIGPAHTKDDMPVHVRLRKF